MKLLLDTCSFLWLCAGGSELSVKARKLINASDATVFVSVASIWEISIKYQKKKLELPKSPNEWVPLMLEHHDLSSRSISMEDVTYSCQLPRIHSDPFDRLLVAVAKNHEMIFLTPDPLIAQYPVQVIW